MCHWNVSTYSVLVVNFQIQFINWWGFLNYDISIGSYFYVYLIAKNSSIITSESFRYNKILVYLKNEREIRKWNTYPHHGGKKKKIIKK